MIMMSMVIMTTSLSGLAVAQLVKEAGFPPGVVNVVPGFVSISNVTINVIIIIMVVIIIPIVVMIIINSSSWL